MKNKEQLDKVEETLKELEPYYNPENRWSEFELLLRKKLIEVDSDGYVRGFDKALKGRKDK